MTSLFLGLPYTRPDNREFTQSISRFMAEGAVEYVRWKDIYGHDVAGARNFLFECFNKEPCDYMLFIDNDASWAVGSIQRLIDADKPVICGGMYTKDIPPRPTIGMYLGRDAKGVDRYSWQEYADNVIKYCFERGVTRLANNAHLFEEPELAQYDGCGMHFTMIRRDVIEALRPPYFIMQGKTGAGEDFYFCRKVKEAGFSIWTDYSVQTAHWSGEVYDFGLRELLKCVEIASTGVVAPSDEPLEVGGDND